MAYASSSFDIPLDVVWRRGRLIIRVMANLILCILTALGAVLSRKAPYNFLVMGLASVVFLFFAIRAARILIASRQPALRLDMNGFESPLLTHGRIDWLDIDNVVFAKRRRTLYLDVIVSETATERIAKPFRF